MVNYKNVTNLTPKHNIDYQHYAAPIIFWWIYAAPIIGTSTLRCWSQCGRSKLSYHILHITLCICTWHKQNPINFCQTKVNINWAMLANNFKNYFLFSNTKTQFSKKHLPNKTIFKKQNTTFFKNKTQHTLENFSLSYRNILRKWGAYFFKCRGWLITYKNKKQKKKNREVATRPPQQKARPPPTWQGWPHGHPNQIGWQLAAQPPNMTRVVTQPPPTK